MTPEDIAADLQDAHRLEFTITELGLLTHVFLAEPGSVTVHGLRKSTGVRWATAQTVISKISLFELRCKINVKPNVTGTPETDSSCHQIPCPVEL